MLSDGVCLVNSASLRWAYVKEGSAVSARLISVSNPEAEHSGHAQQVLTRRRPRSVSQRHLCHGDGMVAAVSLSRPRAQITDHWLHYGSMISACMFCVSLYEWMAQMRGFVYYTHWIVCDTRGDFSICRLSKWGHKYMNNISRTALRVTSFEQNYHHIINTHGSVKVFTATRQNKSSV